MESKLKALRLAKGLTQKEVAEKSGMPLRAYQHYEQGTTRLGGMAVDRAVQLAKVLGVTIEELIE